MKPDVQVDNSLTEARARQKILEYFDATLRSLPDTLSLARQHPRYPDAFFGDAHTVPCGDDDTVADIPLNVATEYWVVGVPGGKGLDYLGMFLGAWDKLGWRTARDDRHEPIIYGYARTPDEYALTVIYNAQGELGLNASSPCFPRDKQGGDPVPLTIPHPEG